MADDEKDRFGDKLRDLEKGREDKYFADRDRELLLKAKAERSSQDELQLKEPGMHCPKCGEHLTTVQHLDVTADECPACRLEEIARPENTGWFARYLGRGR